MPKHAFTFWLAIQDRLSTFDRLVKWGWQGKLLCGFCRNKCESRDHIFFECSFSSRMWQQVVWECLWQQVPDHCGAVIDWGGNLTGRSIQSVVGKMAIAVAVYHIWRPRNICKFSKIMFTDEQMVKRIFFGNKMENRGLCA